MKKMIKKICLLLLVVGVHQLSAQTVAARLKESVTVLEKKPALQGGILSVAIQDAQTGEWVYRNHSTIGIPAASTQKIITAATAYDLLGKNFKYKTTFYYTGSVTNKVLKGDVHIVAGGDPTFGSWRWAQTHKDTVIKKIIQAFLKEGIHAIEGKVHIHETVFDYQSLPGGYTYNDMGNYYGAGSWSLNWNENQYDLQLTPGKKVGDTTTVLNTTPSLLLNHFKNNITTGAAGSGDQAYIYVTPYATQGFATGTVPAGTTFTISGSMPYPAQVFAQTLELSMAANGIELIHPVQTYPLQTYSLNKTGWQEFFSVESPELEKISYWFLRKSINLYGEVMVKSIDAQAGEQASLKNGLNKLKAFWEGKGIAKHQLKMVDGSGLSPENRITAEALVKVLQYARKQSWYASYLEGFPLYNNMKLKSGTIAGVKAFAGVHRSKAGKEYNIAIIAYNYNGAANSMVQEMYKILDLLK